MMRPSGTQLGFVAVALTAAVLASIGAPTNRPASLPPAPPAADAPASVVAFGGVTLRSVAVDLPPDEARLPAGAGSELVTATCTGCHSATMMLAQPPLTHDQWQAIVVKMREAYKAPVMPKDEPGIVAYLTGLNAPALPPGPKPAR